MHAELYKKGLKLIQTAKKFNAADKIWSGDAARLMHPKLRLQLLVSTAKKEKIFVMSKVGSGPQYWVSAEGMGVVDGSTYQSGECPVEEFMKLLSECDLLPYPERLYGLYEGGRVAAIFYTYQKGHDICTTPYALQGAKRPSVEGRDRTNLKQWWQLVQQGRLRDVVDVMKADPVATFGGDVHGEKIILTDASWTKVGGTALYLTPGLKNLSLEEAKAVAKRDLRKVSYTF